MAILLIYPFLAALMLSLDHATTSYNNTPLNGYGGIWPTVKKEARLPMRHRVLVPWLYAFTFWLLGGEDDPPEPLPIYLFWKWFFMAASMMVAAYFFSHAIALLLALYWMVTLQYDYWSVYTESLAFLLVLTGDVRFAAIGVVIGALSKDTAIVLPVVFLFTGGGWWTTAIAILCYGLMAFVRVYQGRHPIKNTLRKPTNCAFKYVWTHKVWRRFLLMGWGVIIVSFVVLAHYQHMPEPFRSTAWVLPAICLAGFFGALVHEPRVFAVNVIWWGALLI